jgi:hypothetical protein
MQFEDILYEVRNGVAWITINRPDKMNAFRGTTCDELIKALNKAGYDRSVGAIVLAGAGDRPSAPAATSRPTTATTTAAAPSACRWKSCTPPSATCPSR